jgi:hypothetical protein
MDMQNVEFGGDLRLVTYRDDHFGLYATGNQVVLSMEKLLLLYRLRIKACVYSSGTMRTTFPWIEQLDFQWRTARNDHPWLRTGYRRYSRQQKSRRPKITRQKSRGTKITWSKISQFQNLAGIKSRMRQKHAD